MSMLRAILRRGLFRLGRTAVIDDQRSYTYGKLFGGALFVRKAIVKTTDNPHVGILLPTGGAMPVSLLATWWAGRVSIPINYLLSPEEMRYVIEDSGIDTILTAGPMLDYLNGAAGKKDAPKGSRPDFIPETVKLLKLEELSFKGLPPLAWPAGADKDDVAVILYTSGTSGKPKGVMLTHGNLLSDVLAGIEHANIQSADAFLGVLPQFHSFGLTALTLMPLTIGARVVFTARFVPKKIIELIREHRPEIIMAVPSMYGALLSVKDTKPEDFASIRFAISGGEPLPNAVHDAYLDRFKLQLLEGYGLTETSPATHWSTPQHHKRYSVGLPLPGVKQLIVDEDNRPVPADTDGEILLAGPIIMKGYYKNEELTRQVMVDVDGTTWFHTGDIGKIDADGYLYITGRKKEMLIIGGENVFPREIEEVLNRHDAVKDAAVIGKTDGMRGEVPIAFVELHEGATFDADDIRRWCRDRLAQFKVPREIRRLDALPRNPTGKILRRQLSAE
jgi:long-chain acyl-CoA synthetase